MKLSEIATLAGVSKTTASYVINGKAELYRISEKTQKKVMEVVNQHNYQPNHAASALRAGSSRSFGLIIPDLENNSFTKLATLLESHSRKAGYQILIGCSNDDPITEKKVAEALVSRRIDALFVASTLKDASHYYLQLQNNGTPVIAIDRPLDDEHFSNIISEDFNATYELTQSVITEKTETIGLIGALPELTISRQRHLGFEAQTKKHNISTIIGYGSHFDRQSGRQILETWMYNNTLPTTIITTSYMLLEGVLDVLIAHPDLMKNITLATFGNHRLLDFLPIKINSARQQFELIADSALTHAINASRQQYEAGVEVIPRTIILRT